MKNTAIATFAGYFAGFLGIYLLLNDQGTSPTYRGIWILPVTFLVMVLIASSARKGLSGPFGLTCAVFAFQFFIRLVILPLVIHLSGPDYIGVSYISVTPDEVFNAIILISWESIVAALFFLLVAQSFPSRRMLAESAVQTITLQGSQIVYAVVAFVGVALMAAYGIPRGLLSFGTITTGNFDSERSSIDMLLTQIMVAGAWLMYILIIYRQSLRYRQHPRSRHFLIALVAGILLMMVIFGDRRSIQIYTGIGVITTLFACFPDRKRAIVSTITITGTTIIAIISLWRMFGRYEADLTLSSFMGDSIMTTYATALQSYFGGPYQIAASTSILFSGSVGLSNVVFDFLRSIFLINFFVPDDMLLTSQIMNSIIYYGEQMSGWLVFTTSYGEVTSGVFFTPIFLILNISLAMAVERLFLRARGLEFKFLFIYLFFRITAFPFTATPLLLSFFSLQLFTIGLIFYIAVYFKMIDEPFRKCNSSVAGKKRVKI